jgi:hypothetical protein
MFFDGAIRAQRSRPGPNREVSRLDLETLLSTLMRASLVSLLILGGCATEPDDGPTSASDFELFDCPQLKERAQNVSITALEVAGLRDSRRAGDAAATDNGIVVFWPAAFTATGEGTQADDLYRLKTEFETIQQASMQKNCSIRFQPQSASPPQVSCCVSPKARMHSAQPPA